MTSNTTPLTRSTIASTLAVVEILLSIISYWSHSTRTLARLRLVSHPFKIAVDDYFQISVRLRGAFARNADADTTSTVLGPLKPCLLEAGYLVQELNLNVDSLQSLWSLNDHGCAYWQLVTRSCPRLTLLTVTSQRSTPWTL